jgi:acyl-CoA reductase-like NAD-dependent aldehyde dehydrogenase
MTVTDKLCLWGVTHAAARDAERAASQQSAQGREEIGRKAKLLREHADRLHREVYMELGPARSSTGSARR